MKDVIIYIHGFRSSPRSEKATALKAAFPGLVAADYDSLHPDQGFRQLDALIRPHLQDGPLLVGSSLGGFWAYHFACRYGLRCVLLNPCMHPEVTLRPFLGVVTNIYTGEQGILTEQDLARYAAYRLADPAYCIVLHETGDEVIPYQESVANFAAKAHLVLLKGGSHRFEQLDVAIEAIRIMRRALER
ncbi:MAG: hypothetical protein N2Z69_07855 [Methylophilaceae bacterium]|nr:hypothetical protein [Methylophilaceae bacterium]